MQVGWFNHPKYVRVRERLIKSLTSDHYRFRRSEPVVFICGGEKSEPRDQLAAYLKKYQPKVRLFYAEAVWELIATRLPLGALKLEAELAELADLVVIIVESPGTFAELGAFSNSDVLRPKLLPIIDKRYSPPQRSFLASGPIRWIEAESNFSPPIYVPLKSILMAAGEVEERISRIKRHAAHIASLTDNSKHLLLFICDLIAIIHPATIELVEAYCARIFPLDPPGDSVATMIALAKAMGLLSSITLNGEHYFSPSSEDATSNPFHHVRLDGLPALRAEQVSALLSIPEALKIIEEIRRTS